jgi:hypothetical protein
LKRSACGPDAAAQGQAASRIKISASEVGAKRNHAVVPFLAVTIVAMFCLSVPRREEEVDAVQTSIRSFGTIYKRDIFCLLPVDARSNKPAVVNDPPKKPDRRMAAVGKRPVSTGIRGVRQWVAVTFFIAE